MSKAVTSNTITTLSASVVIADDHPLFRNALKQAVNEYLEQPALAEANNFDELLTIVQNTPSIEIVFLDLHMPGNNGFTGLTKLLNFFPDLIVIMVSSDDAIEVMQKAIDFGAAAFIPKSTDLETIGSALDKILDGDIWLPENARQTTNQDQQQNNHKLAQQLAQLTPQQYTVLAMIADGQLNKQIAYQLDIKETTVKKHVSAILQKLEVNNRTLAGIAYQQLKVSEQ